MKLNWFSDILQQTRPTPKQQVATMWLKPTIVILFIAILISLGYSVVCLLKDKGKSDRTRKALGIRVILAVLLIACVSYGLWSGDLTLGAPWHR